MLSNYLKTAFRSLLRHRVFSFINVFGLAVAMALSMCIIMLVADQMMYDRYNTRRDRIYRINSVRVGPNGERYNESATSPLPLKQEIADHFTAVEKSVRVMRGFGNMWLGLETGHDVNIPLSGYYADPEVLDIFEYELEHGDISTALVEPFSVVLTRKTAKKLFGDENALGKTFMVGVEGPYKVTGILRETTNKSHIAFDAFASISTVKSLDANKHNRDLDNDALAPRLDNWYDPNSGWVYVLMKEGSALEDLNAQLEATEKAHYSVITNPGKQSKLSFIPQALMSITPGNIVNNSIGPVLPWLFVYFFAGLAAIVLLTSCFNFTNLSIARSLTRAREIGVRKVTGAARWQIFLQFLSESVITSLVALAVALLLVTFLKPMVLQLSFANLLRWDLESNYFVYAVFIVFAIVVGILAGFFPAVVLSGFQPVTVLKNLGTMKLFSQIGLRKALLVAQFTFSLIFILSVIIVFNQLQLFLRTDHGFAMEKRMLIGLNNIKPDAIKTELLKYSSIESVSAVSHIPAAGYQYGTGFKKSLEEKEWTDVSYFAVDEDYLLNIEIDLLAGKFFSTDNGLSNKNFIVLNEIAVTAFQFNSAADAIGQELILQDDSTKKVVIGVVENYNHDMLMEKVEPLVLMYRPEEFRMIQVQYNGTFEEAGKAVEKAWANVNPGLQVDYKDFYGEIHRVYDILFGDLVSILSVIAFLAIFISCLGLLGMATYTTETRIKEISIRKVLGSSNGALIYLLSKGFGLILLIAIVIAVPLAYLLNNLWLEQLAYHVTVDATTILTGIIALLVFGTITIVSQTWRATYVKPVENLKSE